MEQKKSKNEYIYRITPTLLKTLKEIAVRIDFFKRTHITSLALYNMEKRAVTLSAHTSTCIEGNPLPLTEVKKIIKTRPQKIKQTEREVLNYNDTLLWLNSLIKKKGLRFTEKLILDIHRKLMTGLLPKSKAGRIRNEPVFVNDPIKRKTIYWPPDHQDVKPQLSHLLEFVEKYKNQIDPILLAGIFHKEFVIIHPFIDGNGRTVRLATKTLLAILGFDLFHLFSFENYYNNNVSKYFSSVGVFGNYYDIKNSTDFTIWLEYFSQGVLDELLRIKGQVQSGFNTSPG